MRRRKSDRFPPVFLLDTQDMVEKMKRLKAEYEEKYGPLEPYSAAKFDTFKWLESPWPWEKEGNA